MGTLRRIAALLAATALVAGACGDDGTTAEPAGDDGLLVVVSTSILGDVVRNVVGDHANVEVLIDAGTDPHAFEPSARQAARLRAADLVVVNGLGLEPNLEGAVEGAERDGVRLLEFAEAADPLPFSATTGDEHAEDEHAEDEHADEHADEHGELDPHVWFDPVRMGRAVGALGDALAEVDSSIDWHDAAERYAGELGVLHDDIEEQVAGLPSERRVLVTNHEVLGYFAHRYGFEVLAAIVPGGSTLSEPSAADLADLVEVLRRERVPAIFAETSQPTRLAETLQREVGGEVAVVPLHTESLGEPGSPADSYVGLMRENTRLIVEALTA